MDQSMMNSDCKVIAEWFGSNCTIPLQVLRERDTEWHDVTCGDALYPHECEYRIKLPKLNGEEIPGIIREQLQIGTKYFSHTFAAVDGVGQYTWANVEYDLYRLAHGVIFLQREDATKCAQAMIKPLRAPR